MPKRIIGIISGKGGVGKTTISVNLSVLSSMSGAEIVLIDGDMGNPGVGLHLGLWGYSTGLQKVLAGECTLDQATIIHPTTGIRVVPSTLEYERGVMMSKLKEVLGKAHEELVIVDSPPGVSALAEEILSSCTEALIVVTPDIPSVMGASKIIELAKQCKVKVSGLVLNRVQNKKYEMHPKEIENTCDARILSIIPEDRAVPESISARIPAVIYAPSSIVSQKFQELAEVLEINGGKTPVRGSGVGRGIVARMIAFLKRMFSSE